MEKSIHINVLELLNDGLHRQHVSDGLSEASGRSQIEGTIRDYKDFLLWAKQRNNQFLPTKWTLNNRMFLRRCEIFGIPEDRPIYDPLESQASQIRLSSTGPSCLLCRHHFGSLENGNIRIRLFSVSHDSPGTPKIMTDRALVLLICPLMWYKSWISPLLSMLVSAPSTPPAQFPSTTDPQQMIHSDLTALNLHAVLLSGNPLSTGDGTLMLWNQSQKENGIPL